MKDEEIEALEKNGIDHKRIEKLKKTLKGYGELKKELKRMERLVLNKDEKIEELMRTVNKSNRSKLLAALKH